MRSKKTDITTNSMLLYISGDEEKNRKPKQTKTTKQKKKKNHNLLGLYILLSGKSSDAIFVLNNTALREYLS